QLPRPTDETVEELRTFLPPYAGLSNPIDVTAQLRTNADGPTRAVAVLLNDPNIDQVIVRRNNIVGETGRSWAKALAEVASNSTTPVLVSILADRSEETISILNEHNLAWFASPEGVVTGAAALYEFGVK